MKKPEQGKQPNQPKQKPFERKIIRPGGEVRGSVDGASEMIPPKRTRSDKN
ncbi:TPA: hypothetical protein P0E26_002439 [Vibrio harveyi]|nr:hypothetical protein [Vibrio harveyi]